MTMNNDDFLWNETDQQRQARLRDARLEQAVRTLQDAILNGHQIPAIKAIRTVTGLGLKASKDISDSLKQRRCCPECQRPL